MPKIYSCNFSNPCKKGCHHCRKPCDSSYSSHSSRPSKHHSYSSDCTDSKSHKWHSKWRDTSCSTYYDYYESSSDSSSDSSDSDCSSHRPKWSSCSSDYSDYTCKKKKCKKSKDCKKCKKCKPCNILCFDPCYQTHSKPSHSIYHAQPVHGGSSQYCELSLSSNGPTVAINTFTLSFTATNTGSMPCENVNGIVMVPMTNGFTMPNTLGVNQGMTSLNNDRIMWAIGRLDCSQSATINLTFNRPAQVSMGSFLFKATTTSPEHNTNNVAILNVTMSPPSPPILL